MKKLVIIAIGGNSLIRDSHHMSVYDQYRAAGHTSHHIAGIVEAGYRVVITHGNGPQVGNILLRSEIAKDNELRRRGMERSVAALVTQVVVDGSDEGFANPTKPIGPFYSEATAKEHQENEGWNMVEDAGRGWNPHHEWERGTLQRGGSHLRSGARFV